MGDRKFPQNTEVIFNEHDMPIEALVHAEVKWGDVTTPAGTRVLFQNGVASNLIVPNGLSATIQGRTVSGSIDSIPAAYEKLFRSSINPQDECPSEGRPWFTPGGVSPLEERAQPLLLSTVLGAEAKGPQQQLVTLERGFTSGDIELPAGTVIKPSPDGYSVGSIYTTEEARILKFTVPPHSLIERRSAWYVILTQHDLLAGEYTAQAGTHLTVDINGVIDTITVGRPTVLATYFTAPAGSTLSFQDGQLEYVLLSEPTPFHGVVASKGRHICFLTDGSADLRLEADATVQGRAFPGGSWIILSPNGGLVAAVLAKPVTIDQLQFFKAGTSKPVVMFHPSGKLKSGYLQSAAVVKGIAVGPGYLRLDEDGSLRAFTSDGDQNIEGAPCLGGTEVVLNKAGKPIRFTAAADWSIGSSHYRRGEVFNGTYLVKGDAVLLDGPTLSAVLTAMWNRLTQSMQAELMKQTGKFPFGRIGETTWHDFRTTLADDHIDLHVEAAIKDLLTNPPFADCDCDIDIDATIKFKLFREAGKSTFVVWIGKLGGGLSTHVCPGTTALKVGYLVFNAIDLIPDLHVNLPDSLNRPLASKSLEDATKARILNFYNSLSQDSTIFDVDVTRVFIDQQQLKLSYFYYVQMH